MPVPPGTRCQRSQELHCLAGELRVGADAPGRVAREGCGLCSPARPHIREGLPNPGPERRGKRPPAAGFRQGGRQDGVGTVRRPLRPRRAPGRPYGPEPRPARSGGPTRRRRAALRAAALPEPCGRENAAAPEPRGPRGAP